MSVFQKFTTELLNSYYLSKVKNLPKIPRHVALIMDGNGRWAKRRNLPRTEGHKAATKAVRKVIEACIQAGINHLSLFAFSRENWNRPKEEVTTILKLIEEQLKENLSELKSQGVRVFLVGSKEELPKFLYDAFSEAERETSMNEKLYLYMMVNYSGRREIVDAVRKIIKENAQTIDEQNFGKFLYIPDAPEPDLIIRTSGEKRISNFYLWQAAYSELYFTSVLFPDFEKYHFYKAIIDYSNRKRRFGGLKEF